MNKLIRRLFISVLTLAFALVTLGATTFAWFTLSGTAKVEEFDMTAAAGHGIEISADGITYRNILLLEDLREQTTVQGSEGKTIFEGLNALTSPNGYQFYELESLKKIEGNDKPNYETIVNSNEGFLEFNLWFRSAEPSVSVYLSDGTQTSSGVGKAWVPDVDFFYRGTTQKPVESGEGDNKTGGSIQVFAADSLRFSMEETNSDFTPLTSKKITVWELNPINRDNKNERLDDEVNMNSGLFKYWEAKGLGNLENTHYIDLPSNVRKNTDLGKKETGLVLTLSGDPIENYYYGYLKVRLWLEGWDPDNFDAIFNGSLSVALSFTIEPKSD